MKEVVHMPHHVYILHCLFLEDIKILKKNMIFLPEEEKIRTGFKQIKKSYKIDHRVSPL